MPKFLIKTVIVTKMKYLVEAESVEEAMKQISDGQHDGYQKEGKEILLSSKESDMTRMGMHYHCTSRDYF